MSRITTNDSTSTNFSNNTNSFNVSNYGTIVDDRSQLLSWLSPLEPKLRHRDVQERRVNSVGEWLIQSEEFKRWCGVPSEGEDHNAALFCYGDPGVGKTFLSSLVVDRLLDQTRGKNVTLGCFYFDFAARKEQSATSVLGSLAKQMISGMEKIPEEISQAFQDQKKAIGGCAPELAGIVKMLQAITFSQPAFMCLDALDECAGVQRVRLLESLKEILEKSPRTRIFVTGRPHIRAEIERRLAGRVTSVSGNPAREDIITYLRVRLGEDETPDAMDESLEADILEKIPEIISEMFLLVSLSIDAILQESTLHRRRERLSGMTDGLGLGDVYGATIDRIKAQGGDRSRLGMQALMWISHAVRPLSPDELCHALAIELGSKNFNAANAPSMSTLVTCCQGLITVNKEASTVRLIHFTLKEYLSAHPNIFTRPHSVMAEICLTYLNSEQVKTIPANIFPSAKDMPFLEYCSLYWGVHAKKELSSYAKLLALDLFREYDSHISRKLLLAEHFYLRPKDFEDYDTGFPFSGLHCASLFGIAPLVAALIDIGCYDINEEGFWGYTPLAWAADNGHGDVVKTLLESKEVNPDKPDQFGQTPLSRAALGGHGEVVKILLGQEEVNPDEQDDEGKTPLMHAAWAGHEEVVKILLPQEGVNPDKLSKYGETPLSLAASDGTEGIVKMLLAREEVKPDRPDLRGETPLLSAAKLGREGAVKILLEREEVNPDKPRNDGRTPLSCAAWGGHEGVVNILLGHKQVNSDNPDNEGKTPLLHAATNGHEGVVKILLTREEVSPDQPDNDDETPLLRAAGRGHERVVQILLGRKEVNPDRPDNYSRTPLWHAASCGHEGVAKILLGRVEVNPDKPDNSARTPLSCAASGGHEGFVRMLLEREEVSPDSRDNDGKTPLLLAAWYGHEEVVKMLLGVKRSAPTSEIITAKDRSRKRPRMDIEE